MSKSNPTMGEIAAHSGVSTATVSRVLSRSGSVSRVLAERVNESIRELGFKRDTQGLIALLAPNYASATSAEKAEGIEEEAERRGYTVVPIHIASAAPTINARNLQLLKLLDFDAIIVLKGGLDLQQIRSEFSFRDVPAVAVNQQIEQPDLHCIDIDRELAMYKAATYLVSLGHRRLVYLTEPPTGRFSAERKLGIDRAVAETGVQIDVRQGTATLETGYQMTRSIFAGSPTDAPTAILSFNDFAALGALEALRAQGIRVPEDVSVIGFDDLFITKHTCPPLTTVHQPWVQMGRLAVQKIDNLLTGKDEERSGVTILESPLIVRESTGPPPS
jgi:DNA-binding LacI/PurR family transcriptional regulator